jgi:aminoglycoside 6'-N-acetyltransferase I
LIVRPLVRADIGAWKGMRCALWPDLSEPETNNDCEDILAHPERFAVFISEESGKVTGFLEASLRLYVDGCATSPVGYIEGWYVDPQFRGAGVGRALVEAAEEWARSKGCTEMGSDTVLENVDSQRAHLRLGYSEVERIAIFRKSLS